MKNLLSCLALLISLVYVNLACAADSGQSDIPINMKGAEVFGLDLNDLSQDKLEDKLAQMGVTNFPPAYQLKVDYGLGNRDVLGMKGLSVEYNEYGYVKKITLYGKITDNKQRKKLGLLLMRKYDSPMAGRMDGGIGRAQWRFNNGTLIDLNNSTFDVVVIYRDLIPSHDVVADEIDVQALKDKLDATDS